MKRLLPIVFTIALPFAFAQAADDTGSSQTGPQIECTTPDGRVVAIAASAAAESNPAGARLTEDATLRCALQEGETTFVLKDPSATLLDHFTFVNENATAAGRLKISVSNEKLPIASAKWVDVDGNIGFRQKRLFNLSMVGVEARYVKLTFRVEKTERVAALGL